MTDTSSPADEKQQNEGQSLREAMPNEVDERALRMWIQDFLYVSPPKMDREYRGISWVDGD